MNPLFYYKNRTNQSFLSVFVRGSGIHSPTLLFSILQPQRLSLRS